MPRKSIADVLTERHGGKWTFDRHTSRSWNCDDGRVVTRSVNCRCWVFADQIDKCRCPVVYTMTDGEVSIEVNVDDPCVYRLNGKNTYR